MENWILVELENDIILESTLCLMLTSLPVKEHPQNPYTVQQQSKFTSNVPRKWCVYFYDFWVVGGDWRAESRIDMRLSADIIIWRRVIHCAVCFLALTAPCYWAKSNFHPLSYILVKNIEFVTWCDPVTEACRTYTPSQTQFWLNRFQVGKGVSD